MFRDEHPVAWHYHRNSSRWSYNRLEYHPERRQTSAFKEYLNVAVIELPSPELPDCGIAQLLRSRASCRRFAPTPLTGEQLSSLLWAAYGTLDTIAIGNLEQVNRTVPSGGGLYPLEVYAVVLRSDGIAPGIYHFNALHHLLERIVEGAPPGGFLTELFLHQPYVPEASCLLVTTAVVGRSLWKYEERGYRYILFEAGHVAQNIDLACGALGLGSLNVGGFFDHDLAQLLELDPELEVPVYVTAVGAPETEDLMQIRVPRGGLAAV